MANSIVISSGHGKYIRGASGYLDEVDEARKVVDRTAAILRDAGVTVKVFHDNTSTSQNQNLETIVRYHNSQTRELDVSVHFNAYSTTTKPMGTECWWVTQKDLAATIAGKMAAAGKFINRGPKYTSNLYFLNKTAKPSVLVEVCFVDSKADADLYRQWFEAICHSLAESLAGTNVTVNSVLPGPTASEGVVGFVANLAASSGQSAAQVEKEFFRQVRPSSLLRRFEDPAEVGAFITFVCSAPASATTGAALRVDGGVVRAIG